MNLDLNGVRPSISQVAQGTLQHTVELPKPNIFSLSPPPIQASTSANAATLTQAPPAIDQNFLYSLFLSTTTFKVSGIPLPKQVSIATPHNPFALVASTLPLPTSSLTDVIIPPPVFLKAVATLPLLTGTSPAPAISFSSRVFSALSSAAKIASRKEVLIGVALVGTAAIAAIAYKMLSKPAQKPVEEKKLPPAPLPKKALKQSRITQFFPPVSQKTRT